MNRYSPHSRPDREASRARKLEREQALPPRVDRDPCPRCGVRRDFGCAHHPLQQETA